MTAVTPLVVNGFSYYVCTHVGVLVFTGTGVSVDAYRTAAIELFEMARINPSKTYSSSVPVNGEVG